ncbi:hypothetical protein GOP47_0006712 [Adiantum capillus-veneris]|uniref:Uncharacterized protein n=1 Tax=Adiantum capillus-veneris TaxID=13818 RepID=A0A9D4V454_ADICA|nr:hypothetical protein GOP47_0006712 [Adiantum capillus-veneris]
MGACSSKPKTTEFEGSMEPRKPTDAAADRPQETERGLENLADVHSKEAPAKVGEGGEAAHANTEAAQATPEPDSGIDEGLLKVVVSRSAEVSSDVLREKEAVQKEASDEFEQKESKVDGVSDEVVQKHDLDVGGVADSASVSVNGMDDKEAGLVDEAKTCEDKAVVSEETGSSQGDAAYVDKTVSPDEEEVLKTPEKRSIVVPEEEASSMLDPTESAGVESPITGVVLAVEPIKKVTIEEDVSKNVATEAEGASAHEDSQKHSKEAAESPALEDGDAGAGAVATKDVPKDVLALTSEAPPEAGGVDILAPTSAVETLAAVIALETLTPAEADPVKDGEEETSQPRGGAPNDATVDPSLATMDSKIDAEECPTDTKATNVPLDVVTAVGDGGSTDTLEMETPKTTKSADSGVSIIESKTEDAKEESVKDKDGLLVEDSDSNGPSQASTPEVNGDGGPTGETIPEREEKVEQLQESTVEALKETADKPHVEHMSSADVQFEDASDAPLKLEAGKSIESGQVPS